MIRTQKIPFLQSLAATPVLLLTGAIMLIGLTIPFTSFGAGIGLQPLPTVYFSWLAATLLIYCLVVQLVKLWFLRKFRFELGYKPKVTRKILNVSYMRCFS
jgi:Mg2+-importing ATPase